jgi:hypothetical protein
MLTRLSRNAGRRHYRVPDAGMTVPNEIVGQCLENTCLYEAYYRQGPPPDWQDRFVSAYASAHPWEDWAETWAHYLHMIDTLEMAATCGLSLRPRRSDEPSMLELAAPDVSPHSPFDRLIDSWFPVAYVLNNLNRGLGQPDGYPFVLSTPVLEKLRYIHDVVGRAAESH